MEPVSPVVRRSKELLRLAEDRNPVFVCRLGYINHYIDDFAQLALLSQVPAFEIVQAAIWKVLGFNPQGKKVWPEGSFETT